MCPIRHNSLLVHVAYPQILGTNGLVVVVVVFISNETEKGKASYLLPQLVFLNVFQTTHDFVEYRNIASAQSSIKMYMVF